MATHMRKRKPKVIPTVGHIWERLKEYDRITLLKGVQVHMPEMHMGKLSFLPLSKAHLIMIANPAGAKVRQLDQLQAIITTALHEFGTPVTWGDKNGIYTGRVYLQEANVRKHFPTYEKGIVAHWLPCTPRGDKYIIQLTKEKLVRDVYTLRCSNVIVPAVLYYLMSKCGRGK